MEGLNQPITQKEKLRPSWEGQVPDILESIAERKKRGRCFHKLVTPSGQVAIIDVEGKPESCPVCFFIARILSQFPWKLALDPWEESRTLRRLLRFSPSWSIPKAGHSSPCALGVSAPESALEPETAGE